MGKEIEEILSNTIQKCQSMEHGCVAPCVDDCGIIEQAKNQTQSHYKQKLMEKLEWKGATYSLEWFLYLNKMMFFKLTEEGRGGMCLAKNYQLGVFTDHNSLDEAKAYAMEQATSFVESLISGVEK